MRICTLLPSATEIVFGLGLGSSVVGVSHECNYPIAVLSLPKLTKSNVPAGLTSSEIDNVVTSKLQRGESLYALDAELLEKLSPDVIITQELCDVCAVSNVQVQQCISSLSSKPQLISLQPSSLEDVLNDIQTTAAALGSHENGSQLVASLRQRISVVSEITRNLSRRPRVFCMEWVDPPYCGGHWMKELVEIAGGEDALAARHRPSYRIPWSAVLEFAPEVIVLTCCGYDLERCLREAERLQDFDQAHNVPAIQTGRVYATDSAAYFARPGPRIVDSLEILAHMIHPQMFPPARSQAFRRISSRKSNFVSA
jgi:iron complex transport system substrate-binding protein